MIGTKHRVSVVSLMVAGLLSAGATLSNTEPQAEAAITCSVRAGSLTAYDNERSVCIYISGDVPKWVFFNTAPDEFRNDSLTQNACLYPGHFYTGIPVIVLRGEEKSFPNFRGSVRWTTESSCPV